MKNNPQFETIFSEEISEQVKVNKQFNLNYQRREKYETKLKNRITEQAGAELCQAGTSLASWNQKEIEGLLITNLRSHYI